MKRHNLLKNEISQLLLDGLNQVNTDHGLTIDQIYNQLAAPPDFKMGHFAFPCFALAKSLRQAPPKIAAQVVEKIDGSDSKIESIAPVGPYVNFKISSHGYDQLVLNRIIDGEYFADTLKLESPKVMIEYSQPNTHKELHVGHTRNMCFGNALARILKYAQGNVVTATYPGDMGTHVAKCLWYLKKHNQEPIPEAQKGEWLGKMYSTANLKLEDEIGTEFESQNREELTAILKQLEHGEGEYFDLWKETKSWSIDLMKESYEWADISFDHWYFESDVDQKSLEYARELESSGLAKLDQGAVGVDLNDVNLGFCILIKSDGTGLYATKDLELARRKYQDGVDISLYVVDFRQSHHFKQVFEILKRSGVLTDSKIAKHISYEMVDMPDGAMSSRKGNIIPLMSLVQNMEDTIRTDFLHKFEGEWSDAEIQETARAVANGAIKYGMLRFDNNRKITFEMADWLRLDGETGPYLQYVHARICSLLEKAGTINEHSVVENLTHPKELELMAKLVWYNDVVEQCADQYKTLHLCSYLFELGKLFNSFYAECPVLQADDPDLKISRLKLCRSVAQVMQHGLGLLGIPAPQRM